MLGKLNDTTREIETTRIDKDVILMFDTVGTKYIESILDTDYFVHMLFPCNTQILFFKKTIFV